MDEPNYGYGLVEMLVHPILAARDSLERLLGMLQIDG
jgi:hypothetical protein